MCQIATDIRVIISATQNNTLRFIRNKWFFKLGIVDISKEQRRVTRKWGESSRESTKWGEKKGNLEDKAGKQSDVLVTGLTSKTLSQFFNILGGGAYCTN